MTVRKPWLHSLGGLAWVGIWLFPLAAPLAAARSTVEVIGLAVFAIVYTVVTWSAYEWSGFSRWRVAGVATVAVLGFGQAAAYGPQWLVLPLFVAACGVAVFGAEPLPGRAVASLLAAEAVIVGVGLGKHDDPTSVLIYAVGTLLASGLVYSVRQMARLISELRSTREELATAAVAQERLRFARDLHDLLGHTLSVIVVKAEAVRRLAERDPGAAAVQAHDIEEIGRRALAEIREAVTGYRETGLRAEVDRARQTLAAAGIAVTVNDDGGPLPPDVAAALAWVVREGATNVVRHSGARNCMIAITTSPEGSTVEVRDDGATASPPVYGNGLRGLAERLADAGGTLAAGPIEGGPIEGGFRVAGQVPVRAEVRA